MKAEDTRIPDGRRVKGAGEMPRSTRCSSVDLDSVLALAWQFTTVTPVQGSWPLSTGQANGAQTYVQTKQSYTQLGSGGARL